MRSLTLVEPVLFAAARAAGAPEHAAWQRDMAPFALALAEGDPGRAAEAFQALWGAAPLSALPPQQRAYITDRTGLIALQDSALTRDTGGLLGWQRLEGLGLPVLLLEGCRSPAIIAAVQTELARRLPMAQRRIVEGAGHMLPITHPGPVAEAVRDHLARA